MNNESKSQADALYWEKIERARLIPPEKRMLMGLELFEQECSVKMEELRGEMPGATDAELKQALKQRLAMERKAEESASYY